MLIVLFLPQQWLLFASTLQSISPASAVGLELAHIESAISFFVMRVSNNDSNIR